MSARKKIRKRDSSREPFASRYSDEERRDLDIPRMFDEIERATRKNEAAEQQKAGGRKLFVSPDVSALSATDTQRTLRPIAEMLARKGKQFKHPRPLGAVDDLGRVMFEILKGRRQITFAQMLAELHSLAGPEHPTIHEVDTTRGGERVWFKSNGKEKDVGKRGLEDRMTRLRKRL